MRDYAKNQSTAVKTEPQPISEISAFAGQVSQELFSVYTNSEIRQFLEELKQTRLDRLHKQLEQARDEHQRLDDDFGKLQREI